MRAIKTQAGRIAGGFLLSAGLTFPLLSMAEEGRLAVEPEIRIEQGEDATYYEHRVNGVLKEIKVVPKVGKPYFLVPADGGAWIREEKSQVLVPKWVLFEW